MENSSADLVSDKRGTAKTSPASKGGKPSDDKPTTPFSWQILLGIGKRYIGKNQKLTLLYLLGAILSQSILPVSATLLYRDITNHYSAKSSALAEPTDSTPEAPQDKEIKHQAKIAASTWVSLLDVRWQYLLWVLALVSVVLFTFLQKLLQSLYDGKMALRIRTDLFDSILQQSPGFFLSNDANRLNMILAQYSIQAQMGLRTLLVEPVLQIISVLIAGWALFGQIIALPLNGLLWGMITVIALFGLIAPWMTALMANRLQQVAGAFQAQNLRLGTLVGNALQAPEEIQAFRAESFFSAKHQESLATSLRLKLSQTSTVERLNVLNRAPGDVVQMALLAMVVFFIGEQGGVSPGTVLALALLTPQFMGQVQALSSYTINRSMTWPSLVTVHELLEKKPDLIENPQARDITIDDATLEFRDVTFSYQPGKIPPVLNGVSYKLAPGQWTGLVGRSGQGKSTSFRLSLRFYDFQSGDIFLGGHSVRDFSLSSLRNQVALMVQLPAFFYDTVRENLRVACPDASDQELQSVCELAGIWPKLISLFGPSPLDEEFSGGMLLSPGNRKRFALARCLLRKPNFIFLDEPTAGLNPEDKFPLIPDLRHACAGKTVFLIEQDMLWLEQICDYILVLDKGSIVQLGTPTELSAQGGLYTQLRDAHLRKAAEHSGTSQMPALKKNVQEGGAAPLTQ